MFRGELLDLPGFVLEWGICPHCNEPLVQDPDEKGITCLKCKHPFRIVPQPAARWQPTEGERQRQIERDINRNRDFITKASGILDIFKCPECGGELKKDPNVGSSSEGPMMCCSCKSCRFSMRAVGLKSLYVESRNKLVNDAARATEVFSEDDLEQFAAERRDLRESDVVMRVTTASSLSPVENEITEFLTEGQEQRVAGIYDPEGGVVGPRKIAPFPPFTAVCRWAFNKPFLKGQKNRPFITKLLQLMGLVRELLELCESEEFHCEECPMWYERCIINLMNTRFNKWKEKNLAEEQTDPG